MQKLVICHKIPRLGEQTIYDYIAEGLAEVGQKLIEYHHLTQGDMDEYALTKMAELQEYIDHHQGWQQYSDRA